MSKTVVGLFHDYAEAEAVVHDLVRAGLPKQEISLIAGDEHGHHAAKVDQSLTGSAGTGAALGGVAGLVLGLAALAIPGIGMIVAAGPVAAALTGAGIGAATGGIMGALSHMGVPEDEANLYAESIRRGGALVTVRSTSDDEIETARRILNRHDAFDLEESDEATPAIDELESENVPHCDLTAPAFREHHQQYLHAHGYSFDQSCVAYRYGITLGQNPNLRDADWSRVAAKAQQNWEAVNGQTWATFGPAVQFAYQHTKATTPA